MQADSRMGWLMQQGDQSYIWMPIVLSSDESPWRLSYIVSKTKKGRGIYISKGAKSLGSPWGAKAQSPELVHSPRTHEVPQTLAARIECQFRTKVTLIRR